MDRGYKTKQNSRTSCAHRWVFLFMQTDQAPSWVFPSWSSTPDPAAQGKTVFLERDTLKKVKTQRTSSFIFPNISNSPKLSKQWKSMVLILNSFATKIQIKRMAYFRVKNCKQFCHILHNYTIFYGFWFLSITLGM